MKTKRYINWKITICFPKVQFNKGVLPWPSLFLCPQSCFLSPLLSLLDQCPQDLFKTIIPLHLYKNLLLEKQLRSFAIYSRTCLKVILGVSEQERVFFVKSFKYPRNHIIIYNARSGLEFDWKPLPHHTQYDCPWFSFGNPIFMVMFLRNMFRNLIIT